MNATHPTGSNTKGILLLLAAVLCFAGIDGCAKWLNQSLPPLQTVFVRYFGSCLFVTAFLNPLSRPGIARSRRPALQWLRAGCLVVATLCAFIALKYLRLTQVTSITFASPLIVAILAGPFLGEKIGPRRVAAVIVGFCGVLVVTRPWSAHLHPAVFLAVATAFANAFYSVTTRLLAAHDAPETTMFYTGLVGAAVLLPVIPFVWHTPDSLHVWVLMGLIGLFGASGHWLLILAHRVAPASTLAPFFYAQLIGATVFGAAVFGEWPDRWTLLGGGIVMGSGIYLLHRERVRQQGPSLPAPN